MTNRLIQRLDYVLLAMIIAVITLQPYFMHGSINFFEIGQYLPQINELFYGKALYRDMFVMRGPLEILMPMSMMALFGKYIGVLNAYFYFGTVLTLIMYAIFALKIFRTRGFAYLFTLVLVARTFPWSCYNAWGGIRFGFGILAILLASIFLKRRNLFWLFLAGAVSSLAFWTSFEMGAFSFISVAAALCLYGHFETKGIRGVLKDISVYMTGGLIASLPFLIYLFSQKAFIPYIQTTKVVLTGMTKIFDSSLCFNTPRNFREFLLALSPFNHNFKYTLPFLFYGCVCVYLWKRFIKNKISTADISIILVSIYGLLLYRGAFRDIEGPQYRMALQPLLLVMFFYLERIYGYAGSTKPSGRIKKALAMLLIITIPLYSVLFSLSKYNKRFFIFKEIRSLVLNRKRLGISFTEPGPTMLKASRAKGVIVPKLEAEEIDGVVDYISSRAESRDIVFTFPDLGVYNFLTDRHPLGRFHTAEFSFMDPAWFREFFSELENKKPRFVICAREYSSIAPFRSKVEGYLDKIDKYLSENYEVKKSFYTLNVLERKVRYGKI